MCTTTVGHSLAPEDPYQELVLHPRAKNASLNEKTVHYTKTCDQGGRSCTDLVLPPYPQTKDKQTKQRIVSSDRRV